MSTIETSDALAGLPTSPRQWVPHSECVFSVPGLLSSAECAPSWIALLWERLASLPLPHLDGEAAAGLPRELHRAGGEVRAQVGCDLWHFERPFWIVSPARMIAVSVIYFDRSDD